MTVAESKGLKKGRRVYWRGDAADGGSITEISWDAVTGPETRSLFDAAAKHGIGFYLGYAELTKEQGRTRRYNTWILVDTTGRIKGKFEKFTFLVLLSRTTDARSKHLRNDTSKSAILASLCPAFLAASLACVFATTDVGLRSTELWDLKEWK